MNLIPLPYKLLGLGLLAVALLGLGWVKGAAQVQTRWDAENARQAAQVAQVQQRQAEATVRVVTKYVDRIKIVREAGETLIKEVPVYVPVEADAACVLYRGFVRLHDAAARGEPAEPAGSLDAAPAGIALSAVAATVADNYQRCRENAEQMRALQEWVRQVRQVQEVATADHLE